MSDLQIKGTIVSKFDVQTFETKSGKDFTKQEFVIETDEKYTQTIKMECNNETKGPRRQHQKMPYHE